MLSPLSATSDLSPIMYIIAEFLSSCKVECLEKIDSDPKNTNYQRLRRIYIWIP